MTWKKDQDDGEEGPEQDLEYEEAMAWAEQCEVFGNSLPQEDFLVLRLMSLYHYDPDACAEALNWTEDVAEERMVAVSIEVFDAFPGTYCDLRKKTKARDEFFELLQDISYYAYTDPCVVCQTPISKEEAFGSECGHSNPYFNPHVFEIIWGESPEEAYLRDCVTAHKQARADADSEGEKLEGWCAICGVQFHTHNKESSE